MTSSSRLSVSAPSADAAISVAPPAGVSVPRPPPLDEEAAVALGPAPPVGFGEHRFPAGPCTGDGRPAPFVLLK